MKTKEIIAGANIEEGPVTLDLEDGAIGTLLMDVDGYIGWSVCNPSDDFDPEKGLAIAILRADSKVPDETGFKAIHPKHFRTMIRAMLKMKWLV